MLVIRGVCVCTYTVFWYGWRDNISPALLLLCWGCGEGPQASGSCHHHPILQPQNPVPGPAKCLWVKCILFILRDLQNVPPDCLSALPFLRTLWTLLSAENMCLGADTFSVTLPRCFLHQANFKRSLSVFKSFLWLNLFDSNCQL